MATTTHATTGTARRASHVLSGAGLVFRLNDEIDALQRDLASASGRRSAKTLAKTGGLRMTLVLLDSGATLDPEATAGGASVHVLEGHVRMQIDGQVRDAGAGEVVVLGQNLRDPIQAVERSAFLVTVAWPEGAGAWAEEAAAGRL